MTNPDFLPPPKVEGIFGSFIIFFFCLFLLSTGPRYDPHLERLCKGLKMQTESLKVARCFSECQVEFLGPRWEMKGALAWKWWQLELLLPPQRRPTVLLLSVRCTERNVTTIDSTGILLFLIAVIEPEKKESSAVDCDRQRQTCHRRCSNQSMKLHYWWHIILSQFGLLVNSKQWRFLPRLTVIWMNTAP